MLTSRRNGPKTRSVAPKHVARAVKRCACPDPLCFIESADSGGGRPHSVSVPSKPELRKKWLRELGHKAAEANNLLSVQDLRDG